MNKKIVPKDFPEKEEADREKRLSLFANKLNIIYFIEVLLMKLKLTPNDMIYWQMQIIAKTTTNNSHFIVINKLQRV